MDISMEARNARAAALAKMLAGGTLCVRTGEKPALGDAGAGTEIVSLPLPGSMTVRDGSIVAVGEPLRALAVARGVPGHWRVEKGGKCVAQGAVGKDFPMPAQDIEQGQMIELRSWLITDDSTGY